MRKMRLLTINGLLATALFAAGTFGVPACASSGNKTSPPATTPGTPPAAAPAAPPPASPPPPAPPAAATPPPSAAAPSAPPAAPETMAPPAPAGRGNPPPPPPPPPAVMPPPVTPIVSPTAPSPDPRVGLRAGRWDAAQAAWNMRMLSTTPPKGRTLGATHSDLAFSGNLVIQGNYNGFDIYDISDPSKPVLMQTYLCPASQNDVSVYRNLLFMSSEATNSRTDCGFAGVPEPVSQLRVRGIRVFDISDVKRPKLVTTVQTCRGSHTHTVVTKQGDDANVFIYVSGTAAVRSIEEVPGCTDGGIDDPNTARFRLEVIKVPLRTPDHAAIVSSPRIFQGLPVPPTNAERAAQDQRDREAAAAAAAARGERGRGGAAGAAGGPGRGNQGPPTGPNQCHDITVYPEIGLAGGACGGLGLLLDIRDPEHPVRLDAAADANMSFWHSATFNNDGTKLLFSDEWGGGGQPRCRETDKKEWGADALFTIENSKLKFHSYYKLPAPQTSQENCVAHNGSLIPIPGRDVMVQAWYQGGVSVFDWTDIDHPQEIAYYDRGPIDATRMAMGGSWSAYWYNGVIVSSEIARGLDIYELLPSGLITENELAAAKSVKMAYWNTQDQQKLVWAPSFSVARVYLDQLARSNGLATETIATARAALDTAERRSGAQRKTALTELATRLTAATDSARDPAKVRLLSAAVNDLANAQR
jgi:LVIVD repeat-containing protein